MNIQIVIIGSESWAASLVRCWQFFHIREGRRKHETALTIEFNPLRAFFFATIGGVFFYLLGAVCLFVWRNQVPHNHIGFQDILLAPITMDRIHRLQGMTNLDQAREDLKNGQVMDAFYKYRAGVSRVPDDMEARFELAQFYIGAGLIPDAINLLIGGLKHGFPSDPRYLQMLFALTQATEDYPSLTRALPILLDYPEIEDKAAMRVVILQLLLKSQLVQQDYAGVIDTSEALNAEGLDKTFYDTALFALLKMGAYEEAESYYASLSDAEKADADIHLLHGILHYSQDKRAEGRRLFNALFRDYPAAWRNHMDAILYLYDEEDNGSADALLNLYMAIHRRNGSALTSIAARFTDLPDPVKTKRILDVVSRDTPQLMGPMWFYYIQALLTNGDFEEAKTQIDYMAPGAPKEGTGALTFQAYQLIINAAAARSQGEYTELVNFLDEKRMNSEVYWEAAEAMRKIGAMATAEVILNTGLNHFPHNRYLSELRTAVQQQEAEAETRQQMLLSDIQTTKKTTERKLATEAIADRLVGHQPAVAPPESLIGDEKLQNISISAEDLNKTPETPD
ncbi:MAG: tetratricopeptide repeat protein [Verrucomicrobiota bacterium]